MKRALLLLPTVVLASACGSGSGGVLGASATKLACPKRAPVLSVMQAKAHGKLVPSGASRVLVCRYTGLNSHPRLHLDRSRLIRKLATVDRLTRELNSLPTRRGVVYCPMDDGSEILLVFEYPEQAPQRVTVGLRGCHNVANGRVGREAVASPDGARLVRQLEALFRP